MMKTALFAGFCSVGTVAGLVSSVRHVPTKRPGSSPFMIAQRSFRSLYTNAKYQDDWIVHPAGIASETNGQIVDETTHPAISDVPNHDTIRGTVAWTAAFLFAFPIEASATVDAGSLALWAYGHYLAMLSAMGTLVAERFMIKPGMSQEEEFSLFVVDVAYLLSLILIVLTGYFRMTEFGKGTMFYMHEILFWVKMSMVGILGGLALFPSITLIKRKLTKSNEVPMSDALVDRMKKVLNAEISAVLSIPLAATFMARGVLYTNNLPVEACIALAVVSFGGAAYVYGKQALTWSEDDTIASTSEAKSSEL